MGLTDPPWQMPYPAGTDRPCDGALAIELLGTRLDYHLTNWSRDDARLRRRPAAFVSYESTVTYPLNRYALDIAQFNTVSLDTAGMVDLNKRPDRVYFPVPYRPALYAVGGTIVGNSAVAPSTVDVRIGTNALYSYQSGTAFPQIERDQTQDRGDPRGEIFSVGGSIIAYQNSDTGVFGDELYMWMEINAGVEFTVAYAELWAFWLTDLVVSL